MTTSFYKFGLSDSGNISYDDHGHSYEVNNHALCIDEYRRASENSSSVSNEQTASMNMEWEGNANTTLRENPVDCKFSLLLWCLVSSLCLKVWNVMLRRIIVMSIL